MTHTHTGPRLVFLSIWRKTQRRWQCSQRISYSWRTCRRIVLVLWSRWQSTYCGLCCRWRRISCIRCQQRTRNSRSSSSFRQRSRTERSGICQSSGDVGKHFSLNSLIDLKLFPCFSCPDRFCPCTIHTMLTFLLLDSSAGSLSLSLVWAYSLKNQYYAPL